jgi:hypothetical protein
VLDDVFGTNLRVEQEMVDGQLDFIGLLPSHVDGEVALRIKVHQEHALPRFGEGAAQVDSGGGLADPTFLVGHRDHSTQWCSTPI